VKELAKEVLKKGLILLLGFEDFSLTPWMTDDRDYEETKNSNVSDIIFFRECTIVSHL